MADDFTMTLLRHIQLDRTTPEGGWLDAQRLSASMGLAVHEGHHLKAPLQELFEAGMIERRFNARKGRDEWRSVGTLPSQSRDALAPVSQDSEGAAREALIHLYRHGGYVVDAELCRALSLDLGALWQGLDRLEAAGLIQRRTDGQAVRLHEYVRDMLA